MRTFVGYLICTPSAAREKVELGLVRKRRIDVFAIEMIEAVKAERSQSVAYSRNTNDLSELLFS